jgi:preprotein translocase subunit SecG
MYIALTVLIILACVLLVLAVLIQNPKGGGLAVGFSASNQVMGVRKTTDFLEKFTWGLLASVIVFCLLGTIILPSTNQSSTQSIMQEKAEGASTLPAPAPAQTQQGQQPQGQQQGQQPQGQPQPPQPVQQNPPK